MIRRFLQNTKNLETQMSLGWEKKILGKIFRKLADTVQVDFGPLKM